MKTPTWGKNEDDEWVEELRGIVIECTEFDCKSLFSVTCKKKIEMPSGNSFPICLRINLKF